MYLVYTGHPGYVFTLFTGAFCLGAYVIDLFARKLQKLTEETHQIELSYFKEITNIQAFYIEEWKKLNQDTHSYYQNMLAQYENSDGQVKH